MERFLNHNARFGIQNGTLVGVANCRSEEEAESIANECNVYAEIHTLDEKEYEGTYLTHCIVWKGPDALEVANKLSNKPQELFESPCSYSLCHPDATPPSKANISDSGYDLSLVDIKKTTDYGTVFYGTGVKVQPPHGFYFDLVGRSSMAKSGYTLANNVGIIDQSYRGEIMVALNKVHPDVPELELPCKLVQLIPRKWHHLEMKPEDLSDTNRGSGGFGSTGK